MCKKENKNVLLMPCKCYLYCEDCSKQIMSQKVYLYSFISKTLMTFVIRVLFSIGLSSLQ